MTALIISNRDRTSGALTLLASKSSGVAYWQFSQWHYSPSAPIVGDTMSGRVDPRFFTGWTSDARTSSGNSRRPGLRRIFRSYA